MSYAVLVFGATGVFAAFAAPAYWFVTYDAFGTAMLATWAVSVLTIGIWLRRRRRGAGAFLAADVEDADPTDVAGEPMGVFRLESAFPLWLALGASITLAGLVWSLYIAACGVLVTLYALWRLARETAGSDS